MPHLLKQWEVYETWTTDNFSFHHYRNGRKNHLYISELFGSLFWFHRNINPLVLKSRHICWHIVLSVEFQKLPSFVHLITRVISSPLPHPPRPASGYDIHGVFIFDDNSTCPHFHPFISSHASSFLNNLLNKISLVLQPHVKFYHE